MTDELHMELRKELTKVMEKYGIINAAFCGTTADDQHVSGMIAEKATVARQQVILTVLNIGRLWQYARESMRDVLNSFEK